MYTTSIFKHESDNLSESIGITSEREKTLINSLVAIMDNPSLSNHSKKMEKLIEISETPEELIYIGFHMGSGVATMKYLKNPSTLLHILGSSYEK